MNRKVKIKLVLFFIILVVILILRISVYQNVKEKNLERKNTEINNIENTKIATNQPNILDYEKSNNDNFDVENNAALDSWIGTYDYSEFKDKSIINQIIEVEVFEENNEYKAYIRIIKANDTTELVAKASGNQDTIDFSFEEIIFSDSDVNFETGEVLFSLNKVNGKFEAVWGSVSNTLPNNQNVFTKRTNENGIVKKTEFNTDYIQKLENNAQVNLDKWIGEYEYYCFIPPNINQTINTKIFKENGAYFGKLVEEGFQVWNEFDVKVVGTTDEIFILYTNNNTENQPTVYEENDVLVSFKQQENGTLLTYWGEITPYLLENQESGFEYFTKVK